LSPSDFFQKEIELENDDFSHKVGDIESILSLFLAKGAPEHLLQCHYRSREESLIKFSAHEWYQNKLMLFPSTGKQSIVKGLQFYHLPETIYDQGYSRTNKKEAEAVAQAAFEHAKNYPELSLGIVAFSVAQKEMIQTCLASIRIDDISCEHFFQGQNKHPFFIKNLENVQGDERDVMFISIGYGRTKEGGLSLNFGPLNKEGGARRLNVLITRAKFSMKVFCNFTAADMDLKHSQSAGVSALHKFLAYAEKGFIKPSSSQKKNIKPSFSFAIYQALLRYGVKAQYKVGASGIIDIGIFDQTNTKQFAMGIICDDGAINSSTSIRDKDILRHQVLTNSGWDLHRIYSVAFYQNYETEMARLIQIIEDKIVKNIEPNTVKNQNIISITSQISKKTELQKISVV